MRKVDAGLLEPWTVDDASTRNRESAVAGQRRHQPSDARRARRRARAPASRGASAARAPQFGRLFGDASTRDAAHDALDEWHGARRDAELAHAESDERERHERLRRHLAAHRDIEVVLRRAVSTVRWMSLQHGRMQRRESRREVRVAAIDRQRVLHEIVRADAEERDVLDERIAATAAAGVSIITPSGMSRAELRRRARSSSRAASSSSSRAARTSSSVTTSGSMMRTSPCTAARSSARSCMPNSSG